MDKSIMKLLKPDWLVIFAICLYTGAMISTNFMINYQTKIAKQLQIQEKAATIIEQNPVYRNFYLFENLRYIYSAVIIPALVVSLYYYFRQKWKDSNPDFVMAIAIFFLTTYFYDIMNDLSLLLGVLLQR